ncbi:hypothetical protein A2U01_0084409, partial [Trifolium medium]|nr:hypothetical protein [Trifolium medium]
GEWICSNERVSVKGGARVKPARLTWTRRPPLIGPSPTP